MSSLSNGPNNKEDDAVDQGRNAYLDIIRTTANDVNNILQSKQIFLVINIFILLVIIFMGRVLIHFVDPLPVPQPPDEFIAEQKEVRKVHFNPYQFSKYNNGIFLFGNLYSKPGSNEEKVSYTLYMGSKIDKVDLDRVTNYIISTPSGDFNLEANSSTENVLGGDVFAEDRSGCYKDQCYVRVYVHTKSKAFSRGIYGLTGISSNDKVFSTREVISNQHITNALSSNPVDYDVSQTTPGEMRISLLSNPVTEIVRVEVHSVTANGSQVMKPYIFWRSEFPATVPFDTSSRSLRIYVTEMTNVFNDKPTRRFKIIGNYPYFE